MLYYFKQFVTFVHSEIIVLQSYILKKCISLSVLRIVISPFLFYNFEWVSQVRDESSDKTLNSVYIIVYIN